MEDGGADVDVEVAGIVEDEGAEVDVEVAGLVDDVEVGSSELVRVVDVEVVATEDLEAVAVEVAVEEAILSVVLGLFGVAVVRSLSLSSPQIPVSHGLVEQHPA